MNIIEWIAAAFISIIIVLLTSVIGFITCIDSSNPICTIYTISVFCVMVILAFLTYSKSEFIFAIVMMYLVVMIPATLIDRNVIYVPPAILDPIMKLFSQFVKPFARLVTGIFELFELSN